MTRYLLHTATTSSRRPVNRAWDAAWGCAISCATSTGAPQHATVALARHVLEVLLAIDAASSTPGCRGIASRS